MDVVQMKRIIMFTGLDDEELGWLYTLAELEERKEEFGFESLLDCINALREGMSVNDREKWEETLLDLYDEGLIRMEIERKLDKNDWLPIDNVSITKRGRIVLGEMSCILKGGEAELSEVHKKLDEDYKKLEEEKKKEEEKEKREEKRMDRLINTGITVGIAVMQSVFAR